MQFLTAQYTDVGIRKKTNQDSMLVCQAQTDLGNVLLAVMCDGMGGLAKGEVASACMVHRFSRWFSNELPAIMAQGMEPELLRSSWDKLVAAVDGSIAVYSANQGISMGTTCVCFLVVGNTYYIMNIGDSRAYLICDNVYQLTKDQTLVQREIDAGRMSFEQSLVDPQRSVLLQCVGASDSIVPDYFIGTAEPNQCYLLCCDGFRHVIRPEEFHQFLNPSVSTQPEQMEQSLHYLTELNKQRGETDNISAILIRTY